MKSRKKDKEFIIEKGVEYLEENKSIIKQNKIIESLETEITCLKNQLSQNEEKYINDLQEINFIATSNSYSNERALLSKIAEMTKEKLFETTNETKIKELNSSTRQSI